MEGCTPPGVSGSSSSKLSGKATIKVTFGEVVLAAFVRKVHSLLSIDKGRVFSIRFRRSKRAAMSNFPPYDD
jgi:hypothetical protein